MCCIYILENKTSHEFVNYELKSVGQCLDKGSRRKKMRYNLYGRYFCEESRGQNKK